MQNQISVLISVIATVGKQLDKLVRLSGNRRRHLSTGLQVLGVQPIFPFSPYDTSTSLRICNPRKQSLYWQEVICEQKRNT